MSVEIRATDSPDQKKVDFGPRIKFSKPVSQETKENLTPLNKVSQAAPPTRRGSVDASSEQASSSLAMKLDIANSRIAQLGKERDEWKQRAETAIANSEGSLGDMLVEIELETLRDEVTRLRSQGSQKMNESSELSALRLRCAELETQVNNLKKEKSNLERKNKDDRNAEISKIRVLQEQISNEKRMRERIANTESALPVVTVGSSQSVLSASDSHTNVVSAKPRAASPAVPSFVVESAKRPPAPMIDPRSLDKTTVVLPAMSRSVVSGYESLGDDAIADQWRQCLADRPDSYKSIVSRQPGTNIFNFGSHRVACKKIGNHTMIQVGRETMLLENFIETFGPQEAGQLGSTPKAGPAVKTGSSSVTLKSITASKNALASKQSSN